MEKFNFTQEQIKEILSQMAEKKEGINNLLQYSLEAMMRAEPYVPAK